MKFFKTYKTFFKILVLPGAFFIMGYLIGMIKYWFKAAPEKIYITTHWLLEPYQSPLSYGFLVGIEFFLYGVAVVAAFLLLYWLFKKGWIVYLGISFMILGGIGIILAGIFAEPLDKTLAYLILGGVFGGGIFSIGIYGLFVLVRKK